MNTKNQNEKDLNEQEKIQKIESLREMIVNAEKTIHGAKSLLLQLEGKKKTGRKRKIAKEETDGRVIQGTFDGEAMTGVDGKQYPVPSNYASKSKLVEGDMLKLTITPEGSFIYKQIGPVERKNLIGIATQDKNGNFYIVSEGKPYKILLASVTYFKIDPGDEVAITVPRDMESSWAAIENVMQKSKEIDWDNSETEKEIAEIQDEDEKEEKDDEEEDKFTETIMSKTDTDHKPEKESASNSLLDEWESDIREIEKELKKEEKS